MNEPEKVNEATLITITVHWFSVLAEKRGRRMETVQIPSSGTGKDLIRIIRSDFSSLNEYREHLRLAVNQEYADHDIILRDGDEVAFITPVSGG